MAAAGSENVLERVCRPCGEDGVRVMVVVAHPDDEVIGCGGRMRYWREVTIVHLTDGSPPSLEDARAAGFETREGYARARRGELYAALGLAGIGRERTREIGLGDQQASLHLVELAWSLAALFRRERPEVVLTHPYEGGHPDHDATAFGVWAACRLMEKRGEAAPVLVEMASYFNRGGSAATGEFLPCDGSKERVVVLSEEERALKERMAGCYASQRAILDWFRWDVERYRVAPGYNFTEAPHEGMLFYELFEWGMTGARWRGLAGEAMGILDF